MKSDEKWDRTFNRRGGGGGGGGARGGGGGGGGGLTIVEIQGFCGICPKTFETDWQSQISLKRCKRKWHTSKSKVTIKMY
jgi:hypothetical protein